MARFKLGWKKKVNIGRVVTKIVVTVLALYVGGVLLDAIGDVMIYTRSNMYGGLTLLGWTVGGYPANSSATGYYTTCEKTTAAYTAAQTGANCITDVTSGTGILSVIGIVGVASVVMEFVQVKMV